MPGATDPERFDNAVRAMVAVSKDELTRREVEWRRTRKKRARAKKRG